MRRRGPNIYLDKLAYFVFLYAVVYRENLLLSCNITVNSRHLIDPRISPAKVHVQWSHDHSPSLTKLLEDRFKVWSELVTKLDVRNNRRRVLIPVRPRLIVARKSRLRVTSASSMITEER